MGYAAVVTVRVEQEDDGRWRHEVLLTEPAPAARFTGSKRNRESAVADALSDVAHLLSNLLPMRRHAQLR